MNYLQAVKDKEVEFNELTARMDADKDLLYLKKYILKDLDGRTFPNIINITLNDAAVFAANVLSALGSTSQQVAVESEDLRLDTAYIEEFQKAAFNAANTRLRKQGSPPINPFFDEQLSIRGRAAARCLFRMEEDILIPDITLWDTRYVTYEMGVAGLGWATNKTKRNKDLIEAEYGFTVNGKTGVVLDVWDKVLNEIWIDNQKVREQENPYGYVPIVFQTVSLGSMLADEDSLSHQGESIFFLIRDLIPELNRLVSILQTLNMKTASQALQYKSKAGARATPPDYEKITAPGAVTSIDETGGIIPIPIDDIKRTATLLHQMIETRVQRGSLSSIDLGTLQFPLSAVALVELGEGRDQVFIPRLQAKALLNQELAEMFTQQVIQIGGSIELGVRGHKRTFETSKLKGAYETTYKYFVKSPKIDIARYSVAMNAERYLDEDTILRDILQVEDPDGIKQKRYYDMAAELSPAVMRTRIIKALMEKGGDDTEFEAELMSAEMGMDVKRVMAGEMPEPEITKGGGAAPVVPLLGKGGQRGGARLSAQKAAELKRTPIEEIGEE